MRRSEMSFRRWREAEFQAHRLQEALAGAGGASRETLAQLVAHRAVAAMLLREYLRDTASDAAASRPAELRGTGPAFQ